MLLCVSPKPSRLRRLLLWLSRTAVATFPCVCETRLSNKLTQSRHALGKHCKQCCCCTNIFLTKEMMCSAALVVQRPMQTTRHLMIMASITPLLLLLSSSIGCYPAHTLPIQLPYLQHMEHFCHSRCCLQHVSWSRPAAARQCLQAASVTL
jgi:hypothetical protein